MATNFRLSQLIRTQLISIPIECRCTILLLFTLQLLSGVETATRCESKCLGTTNSVYITPAVA